MGVKNNGLFADLDDETFKRLAEKMTDHTYGRGKILYRQGEQSERIYLVVSGLVKIGRFEIDGQARLRAIASQGEIIGELEIFEAIPRQETAIVTSKCLVTSIKYDYLRPVLEGNAGLALRFAQRLARRIRQAESCADGLVFSNVPGRVARAIIDLSDRCGEPVPDGLLVRHELTQEELAQLVGASRETVNKALAEFMHRGWIRLGKKTLTILDLPALEGFKPAITGRKVSRRFPAS